MRAWQSCQRGWWLTYYRQLRPQFDHPYLLTVGNMVHDGLQKYYEGQLESEAINEYFSQLATKQLEGLSNPDEIERVMDAARLSGIMIEGYFQTVEQEGWDVGLEFAGAEQTVEADVGPWKLRGKIDARFRRETDGALLQMEHKTVGDFRRVEYAQQDPQFLTYDLLALLTKPDGVPTDGILLNMLRRVKRTARAKPPFYSRHEVRHNLQELRSHYQHVVGIGHQIATARDRLDAGESFHEVCPPSVSSSHQWSCDCAKLGALPDDGSDLEFMLQDAFQPYDPWARYKDAA
jgi:hypothetical protein